MTAAFGVLYRAEHCFLAISKTNLVNAYIQVNIYVQLSGPTHPSLVFCVGNSGPSGRPTWNHDETIDNNVVYDLERNRLSGYSVGR
jgi:hypothetical protein